MTRQEFEDLVRRVEARFHGRQAALERATDAWVALGLAGLLTWVAALSLLGLAAFAAGVVVEPPGGLVLLVVAVVVIVYALSQAGLLLLVETSPADGRRLGPGEAPELTRRLDALRREMQCRPFDEVRITNDFNASVRETPRLGLLGRPRTTLEIGLPLLSALSPEELGAVLAHEFVHLSARHGRGGHRIARVHRTWFQLLEQMQRPATSSFDRSARWAVSRFMSWYWPRLRARSLTLSRMHEFQADRVASRLLGGDHLARALWRMECLDPWLRERFWPDLHQQADSQPEPPSDVIDRLRSALEAPPPADDAARWVERGLSRATDHHETHPACLDRVQALGVPAEEIRKTGFPAAVRASAALVLLGDDLAPIEQALNAEWRRSVLAAWRDRHRRATAEARRRAEAESSLQPQPQETADTAALWEAAREAAEHRGLAAAEPLLRAVLGHDPSHPGVSVMLGHHLLGSGDAEGERLLLQVVEQADESWMSRACEALAEHYRATGRLDRLRDVRARLDRHDADLAASQRERATVGPRDPLLPHGLAPEPLRPLRTLLAAQPDCATAWLVRKDVRYFPRRPLFLLCVRARSTSWGFGQSDRDRELARRLVPRVELPGQVLVIAGRGPFRKLAARVMAQPRARIFPADGADRPASPARADSVSSADRTSLFEADRRARPPTDFDREMTCFARPGILRQEDETLARARHPHKEIEAAIQHAEDQGWRVSVGGSHAWGFLFCPFPARDGCRVRVNSTPRNPEGHARRLIREIDSCPHAPETP